MLRGRSYPWGVVEGVLGGLGHRETCTALSLHSHPRLTGRYSVVLAIVLARQICVVLGSRVMHG